MHYSIILCKFTNVHHSYIKIIIPLYSIAIFASGAGSNAQKIIEHFKSHPINTVRLMIVINQAAGVIAIAASIECACIAYRKGTIF